MTQAARMRDLLRRNGMVVAPGAYDCITARLIERAGSQEHCAHSQSLFRREVERVEHDRFCEGDRENRLDQDRRGRTGITTDRGRRAHTDQTHADRRAEGRQTDVNASG